jgi:hypothetical protein
MRRIKITAGSVSATAVLKDNFTADAIWEALPISTQTNTWGDELYFKIPVNLEQAENASDVVEMGDLAYWPPGQAFCVFFGPTPASRGNEIRAASEVNVLGQVEGDATVFLAVKSGDPVALEKIVD